VVVYTAVPLKLKLFTDPARTIFVAGEPSSFKQYPHDFLAQFGTVLTTDRNTKHKNCILTQVGLPWHVGIQSNNIDKYPEALCFEDFQQPLPLKTKLCSVICSDKTFTPQHCQRIAFVQYLKEIFGDQIDVFGRGFRDMADKDEALADYRYHIVLENSSFEDY